MRTLLLTVLIFALAPTALAETLYRWVGPDGTVHYSDTPPPKSAKQAQELERTPGAIYSENGPKGVPDFTDQRATPYKPGTTETPKVTGTSSVAPTTQPRLPLVTSQELEASVFKGLLTAVHAFMWAIVLGLVLSALQGLTPKLKGMLGESRIRKRLQRAGIPTLHDVILPDSQGGLTQIDHLALMPWGIAVIETKYREGWIFGKESDVTWTSRAKWRKYPFQNPLRQNHKHILAVQALVPAVAAEGLVVFTGEFEFPNGMPRGVAGDRDLLVALERTGRELPNEQALQTAWATLAAAARTDRASRRQHLKTLHERFGGGLREPIAYAMLILAAGLAVWQWVS